MAARVDTRTQAAEWRQVRSSCAEILHNDQEHPPHVLPFQCIFDELWERRADDLRAQIQVVFPGCRGKEREELQKRIDASTAAYLELAGSKEGQSYGDRAEERCHAADRELLAVLHRMNTSALCLSGGGIRSASYCLGTLQGLARFGYSGSNALKKDGPHLLTELDYLSTVSGGGYIGSWLLAWTKRVLKPAVGQQEPDKSSAAAAFRAVVEGLAGRTPHTSGDPAPRAVRHLRDYTSFLAPKLGLTLDTWSLAVIVLRNLLVNWLMILPVLVSLIASVQLLHHGLFRFTALWVSRAGFYLPFAVASVSFLFAGCMAGIRMPSRQAEKLFGASLEPRIVGVAFVGPLGISSIILLSIWLQTKQDFWIHHPVRLILWFSVTACISFASIPIIRTAFTSANVRAVSDHTPWIRYVTGVAAAIVSGVILAVSVYAIGKHAEPWLNSKPIVQQQTTSSATLLKTNDDSVVDLRVMSPAKEPPAVSPHVEAPRPEVNRMLRGWAADRFILFAFPCVWGLLMLGSSLFSSLIGEYEADIDREWWARAGGIMMFVLAGWIFFQGAVIFAPILLSHSITIGKLSGAGLLTGLIGAFGGYSTTGRTGIGSSAKKTYMSTAGAWLSKAGFVVPAICFAALVALVLLLANFEAVLAKQFPGIDSLRGHFWIWIGSMIVGLLVNWAVNVNIFSLHGMYRMRLMRAFLGSSNTRRKPDKFTGFDERDLIWESEVPYGPGLPLHIINATVNLVGTNDTAWSQRKAEGFTFSPISCGGWRLGYVPTRCYGGNRGVSLSTAMAISGAAFNPNMGYHSSPLVTLIMTLFNVRLGWWLPNPKYRRKGLRRKLAKWMHLSMHDLMAKKSPRLALGPMINEMLGGTNDSRPYIELTDGGHFENLGVYEMVLRRCKRIIVVDVGADPKCEFEDLGNALRKIEIDLGVPIEFRGPVHMQAGVVPSNLRCAIADIRYECVDGGAACTPGTLVYIKAVMNGQEPPDVLQYSKTHSTFPHESTTNQFFTESQFESYRHLGSFAIDQIVASAAWTHRDGDHSIDGTLQQFFEAAQLYVNNAMGSNGDTVGNWELTASLVPEI